MLALEEFVEIGYIRKGHGYKGHARVVVFEQWEDDLKEQNFVFIEIDGYKVPFAIEERQVYKDLVLKFEQINSVEALKQYHKRPIYLLKKDIQHAQDFMLKKTNVSQLIGLHIHDKTLGDIGEIIRIDEYPQQEMAVILSAAKKEVLIPLHDSLIIDTQYDIGVINMDLPEGLV